MSASEFLISNFNKTHKKQGFTSLDTILCLSAILALAVLIVPIFAKHSSSQAQASVIAKAQKLSYEILKEVQLAQQAANNIGKRQIASSEDKSISMEGIIGTDPWGNPFHYRVLKNLYGQPTHLVVWSRGSNSRQDTSEYEFESQKGEVHFSGDDLGYILEIPSAKS